MAKKSPLTRYRQVRGDITVCRVPGSCNYCEGNIAPTPTVGPNRFLAGDQALEPSPWDPP